MLSKEALLALAVLADVKDFRPWMNGLGLRDPIYDFSWNIFKLEGDDVHRSNERVEQLAVRVRTVEFSIRNLPRRTIRRGLEGMDSVAHPARGNPEHPAQLSAAQ